MALRNLIIFYFQMLVLIMVKKILSNINLNIEKGKKIGIVGHTGSGKSTFIDLLMGLNFQKVENLN